MTLEKRGDNPKPINIIFISKNATILILNKVNDYLIRHMHMPQRGLKNLKCKPKSIYNTF